jgi:hypothetical protein
MVSKFISIKELFPELYKTIPGLIKGTYYAVTGATSSAKTKFTKFLFVSHAYKYCKANDIPLKIVYFALEEGVEKFWITIKCDLLFEKYGETVTFYQYKGYHEGMTDLIKSHLDEFDEQIEDMKKCINVVDFVSNPTGIMKKVTETMFTVGKKIKETEDGDELGNKWKSFEFVYDNPDTHVIVVVDHASLISLEKNPLSDCSTLHLAMGKWSEYVIRYVCKKYQCIVCDVQQQAMSGDNEVNVQNNPDLLLPALSKFADNLMNARNFFTVFSVFNPSKYKAFEKNYKGYNMEVLKNKFRWLTILKHRDGVDNVSVPLLFDGRINYFKELPHPTQREELQEIYKQLNK